jgi:hypothetical protein
MAGQYERDEIHWSESWSARSTAMGKRYPIFLLWRVAAWASTGAAFSAVMLALAWISRRRAMTVGDAVLVVMEAALFGGVRVLMDLLVPREVYVSRASVRLLQGKYSFKRYALGSGAFTKVEAIGASVFRIEFCNDGSSEPCLVVGAPRKAEKLINELPSVLNRANETRGER